MVVRAIGLLGPTAVDIEGAFGKEYREELPVGDKSSADDKDEDESTEKREDAMGCGGGDGGSK